MVRGFDSYIQHIFYPINKNTLPILLCGTAVVSTVVDTVVSGEVVDTEVVGAEVVDTEVVGDEVVDAEVVGDEVVDAEVVGDEVVGGKLVDGGVLALCRQTSQLVSNCTDKDNTM